MDLILWRHAEAEEGYPDLGRRLTENGHDQARRMAAWLRDRLPPATQILCSPAERCQQTAEALSNVFTTMPELAPGASIGTLLNAARWPRGGGCVVLINHQPTLGELVSYLLCGEAREWSVKKGSIWWLSTRTRDRHTQAVLKVALSPEML